MMAAAIRDYVTGRWYYRYPSCCVLAYCIDVAAGRLPRETRADEYGEWSEPWVPCPRHARLGAGEPLLYQVQEGGELIAQFEARSTRHLQRLVAPYAGPNRRIVQEGSPEFLYEARI